MKMIVWTLPIVFSASLAHAYPEGGHLWLSRNPTSATCDSPAEKKVVLDDAYSKCRQNGYGDSTCRNAVNEAKRRDNFTSQTGGWVTWDKQGTYCCNLFIEIFL